MVLATLKILPRALAQIVWHANCRIGDGRIYTHLIYIFFTLELYTGIHNTHIYVNIFDLDPDFFFLSLSIVADE